MTTPLALVQAAYAAFGSGDVPTLLNLLTPDVRWEFAGDSKAPYTGRVQGRSQVGEWLLAVAQVDGIQAFEPREFLVGADHITVLGWERTQALPNGGVFESPWVHVWQVRDSQLSRFFGILDTEAAAKARP